ncbi:MAG: MBL fold metallo-hydrolase [bacterium]
MNDYKIYRIQNGFFNENCFILQIDEFNCFLIDPGLDGDLIQNELEKLKLKPLAIFCTHGHFDHIGSVSRFQKMFGCNYYLHKDDIKVSKSSNFLLKVFKIDIFIDVPIPDVIIDGDNEFTIDNISIKYIHTPGHTPGSSVICIGNNLFSGDTLLINKEELVFLPGQDNNKLAQSILKLKSLFPDDYNIYPGHGNNVLFGLIKTNFQVL